MPSGVVYLLIAVISLVLFLIYRRIYKNSITTRKHWAGAMIGGSIGILFASWKVWLDSNDLTGFWGIAVIFLTGIIMLMINRNIRSKLYIVLVSIIYYFIILIIKPEFWSEISRSISYSQYFLISAIFLGIIHFIIARIAIKSWKRAIIPSIQLFLITNILPYIPLPGGWNPAFFVGTIGAILCYIIILLPEIWIFIGITALRKNKILGIASVIIATIIALEVVPVRMVFWLDESAGFLMRKADQQRMRPYGKIDREYEFKRSLQTLQNLAIASENFSSENKDTTIIYIPDLDDKPNFLKLDTVHYSGQYYKWEYFFSNFKPETLLIDIAIDTDGDGLSDFREAELLSDAYNKDTDEDGLEDKEDSDPLNSYKESSCADIYAAVLDHWSKYHIFPFYIVDGYFYNGRGEIGNFTKQVLVLHFDQVGKWNMIFGEQYLTDYGQRSYYGQYVGFSKYQFDLFGIIAAIGVTQHHGIWSDSSGLQLLLVKWRGQWQIIAAHLLWI